MYTGCSETLPTTETSNRGEIFMQKRLLRELRNYQISFINSLIFRSAHRRFIRESKSEFFGVFFLNLNAFSNVKAMMYRL